MAEDMRPLLVLYNIAKRANFGELLRTAAAFGVSEVVVVGMPKIATMGAHNADKSLRFTHVRSLETAIAYVRQEHKAHVCGIEIVEGAHPVGDQPFRGRTGETLSLQAAASSLRSRVLWRQSIHSPIARLAQRTRRARARPAFMVGNEGHGMSEPQLATCDHFVYIPQYSTATASLNVNCAAGIVLENYARWAKLREAPRMGYKYVVPEAAPSTVPRSGMGIKQMVSLEEPGATGAGTARAGSGSDSESSAFDPAAVLSQLGTNTST
jgi:tRNA C32,U32 (ribose-2'-O)-methylase TrmJ